MSSTLTCAEPNPLTPLHIRTPVSSITTFLILRTFLDVLILVHVWSIISLSLYHLVIGVGLPSTGQTILTSSPTLTTTFWTSTVATGGNLSPLADTPHDTTTNKTSNLAIPAVILLNPILPSLIT